MKKIFAGLIISLNCIFNCSAQLKIYVAPNGNDKNPGTIMKPFKSPVIAVNRAIQESGKDVIIELRGGNYSIDKTIDISSSAYKLHSLTIHAYGNENVTISGAKKINLNWRTYKTKILMARLNLSVPPDRLFINGKNMPMARYPNYDSSARVFNGTAADAISDERVRSWNSPAGGYIHALHNGEWGDFHYRITGKTKDGKLEYEGGWQNNRPAPMHKQYRFVENIFEELDAPGEWFYDINTKIIYVYPPTGVALQSAKIEISQVTDMVHIVGKKGNPVKNVTISNIHFTQNERSFMLTKEPLLRSDWTIYRGGAILLDETENITISNCTFSDLGGNAVFLSNYNKNDLIKDNYIHNIGASAIAFVGSADAVRSPVFSYDQFVPWKEMNYTPGPNSNDYPQYCTALDNLINNIGTIEKQVAGVEIDMAAHITVSHNTIYHTPRAGINIGDGCWGGHIIEFNDVFNTVLETGDHGAFNSWGRDRYWRSDRSSTDSIVAARPGIELLDVVDPIILQNNRFQCDHGWDIDLDDGSSNYKIYNNVCLNGGLKLREGYHRVVTNNIIINNTFHAHVWFKKSDDVFAHNIVTSPYAPVLMTDWGREIDSNFFLSKDGLTKAQLLQLDKNSTSGDAMFVNADKGNYRLKPGSPAFKVGFKNFDMDFGVTLVSLKKLAAKPPIKPLLTKIGEAKGSQVDWLGAKFKNIETLGERSAAGLHDSKGALLIDLQRNSIADKNNLRNGDVIIRLGNDDVTSISDLLKVYQSIKWMGRTECTIVRNQAEQKINLSFNKE